MSPPTWRPSPPARVASAADPPDDLRLWLGEDRLLRAAIESAAHHAASAPGPRIFRHGDQSFPTAQLLALLAFCYLTARLDSVAIEEELETDEVLRYLCAGRFPTSPVLRQFRRVHRDTLVLVLADLLSLAICEQVSRPFGQVPGAVSPPRPASDWIIELAAKLGRQGATSRLARAVLADTMALDV